MSRFESQFVLLPLALIVIVLGFIVFLTELENILARHRTNRFFAAAPRRRRWRRPRRAKLDERDLQRALLDRTSRIESAGR